MINLKSFTQLIVEVFVSRSIDSLLLPENERDFLKKINYIDADEYPTARFDQNSILLTNNQKNVISHHFFQQKLVFPLTSFLSLNRPPEILKSMQSQFELQNNNKSWVLIERKVDFQIPISSFYDPDDDPIEISFEKLSNSADCLIFDSQTRRFYGIPTKNHKGIQIKLRIIASDGYAITDDILSISVIKNSTNIKKNVEALANSNVFNVFGTFLFYSPYIFEDFNGDELIISAKCFNKKKSFVLPDWMVFDNLRLQFQGTALPKYFSYNVESKLFYQEYMIIISAKNIADEIVSRNFTVFFKNFCPKLNNNKKIQYQFTRKCQNDLNSINLEVEISFDITFEKDTFIDDNVNSNLQYSACLYDGNILPEWIQFDSLNFKLIFKPTEDNLNDDFTINITASNGVQSISDSFRFKVSVSWIYILKLLAKIVGPIVAVLGFLNKRSIIYNFFCKRHYEFKMIEIPINQPFIRDFYLIEKYLRIGSFLVKKIETTNRKFMEKKSLISLLLTDKQEELSLILKDIFNTNRNMILFSNIEKELFEKEHTLYVIVEGFLLQRLLHQQNHLKKLYKNMKKGLESIYLKNWYSPFVTIIDHKRDLKYEIFPKIELNLQLIKTNFLQIERKHINSSFFGSFLCKKTQKIGENELSLIYAMVKNDALGIPESFKQWYHFFERAKGESILIPTNAIQEIRCKRVANRGNGFFARIGFFFNFNYTNLEMSNNRKLPCWLDYEITFGVLRFSGNPSELDKGLIVLDIIDMNGIIVKEFEINLIENERLSRITKKKSLKSNVSLRKIMREKHENFSDTEGSFDENKEKKSGFKKIHVDHNEEKTRMKIGAELEMSKLNSNSFVVGKFLPKYKDDSERSELDPNNFSQEKQT